MYFIHQESRKLLSNTWNHSELRLKDKLCEKECMMKYVTKHGMHKSKFFYDQKKGNVLSILFKGTDSSQNRKSYLELKYIIYL